MYIYILYIYIIMYLQSASKLTNVKPIKLWDMVFYSFSSRFKSYQRETCNHNF